MKLKRPDNESLMGGDRMNIAPIDILGTLLSLSLSLRRLLFRLPPLGVRTIERHPAICGDNEDFCKQPAVFVAI